MQEQNLMQSLIRGAGYSAQADLARSLGWSRQKLNNIVHGRNIPTLEDTSRLSQALNVSIGELSAIILAQK